MCNSADGQIACRTPLFSVLPLSVNTSADYVWNGNCEVILDCRYTCGNRCTHYQEGWLQILVTS